VTLEIMRFRLTAFGRHLLGSASALTLVLGGLYLGWYRWPGWYLASALYVVGIVALVDVVLGPTLTLIVAHPGKPRRVLARDIAVIVTVQLVALVYGTVTLWKGRPLYYAFSVNSVSCVQASDLDKDEIALARRTNATLAPHWYSLPRWVWAPLPENAEETAKIAEGTVFGGKDVVEMPRYFRPWDEGLPKLREQLARLDDLRYFNKEERQVLRTRLGRRGLPADARNVLVMWGASRRLLAVFDTTTLRLEAMVRPD
jgi:hypothetical protein